MLKWPAVALAVLALVILAVYLSAPWLIARTAPYLGEQASFETLEVSAGYPRLDGWDIESVHLQTDALRLQADGVRVSYDMSALIQGRLHAVSVEAVEVVALPGRPPTAGPPIVDVAGMFAWLPLDSMTVQQVSLQVPAADFAGSGRAEYREGAVTLWMLGVAPEVASRFSAVAALSADGAVQVRMAEQGTAQDDFLTLQGAIAADFFDFSGRVALSGYVLQLASALIGVPQGTGAVEGVFAGRWPLAAPTDLSAPQIDLTDFNVDWSDARQVLQVRLSGDAEVSDAGAQARVTQGRVVYSEEDLSLRATIPEDFQLAYRDEQLSASAGVSVEVRFPAVSGTAKLQKFSLTSFTSPVLDAGAQISAEIGAASVRGDWTGQLRLQSPEAFVGSGAYEFNGAIEALGLTQAARLKAQFELSERDLSARGVASFGLFEDMTWQLDYDLQTTAGQARVAAEAAFADPLAASFIGEWQAPYDLDAGALDITATVQWQNLDKIGANIDLKLASGAGHYDEIQATGISGEFVMRSEDVLATERWRLEPTTVNVDRIYAGVPAEHVEIELSWHANTVRVGGTRADVLGGQLTTGAFDYQVDPAKAAFEVDLEDIDLAQIVALEGDDVAATGRLDGQLPVVIDAAGVSIAGGRLEGRVPGGVIRLSPALAVTNDQTGLGFALTALQDFHYTELTVGVDYAPNGDLALGIGLLGSNAAVRQGRAIRYNLNITENIPVLLESLRVQEDVTRRIEEQVLK